MQCSRHEMVRIQRLSNGKAGERALSCYRDMSAGVSHTYKLRVTVAKA